MEKRIRPFTTILLILLAVVISSGATYLFVTDQANKESDNLQSQIDVLEAAINAQKSTATTATTDETADWKTYTNTTYGFSFKYPKDWTINEDVPASYMSEPWKSFSFDVSYTPSKSNAPIGYVGISKKSITELKTLLYNESELSEKSATFANSESLKVTANFTNKDTGNSSVSYTYLINKNGNTYIIDGIATSDADLQYAKDNQITEQKVLSTFQFTK